MHQVMFAAGCFWGVQAYFDQVPGVTKTTVGYSGGHTKNPSYEDVCYKDTGHAEVTLVEFDPKKVSYETLVKQFFYMHDPTQLNRQGPDVGDQYRSAIFTMDDTQQAIAESVRKEEQEKHDKPIVTEIKPAGEFYEAEDYHQKYTEKTGRGMCHVPFKEM
jgi:peptide-methionine (S)-S-oxide reductase